MATSTSAALAPLAAPVPVRVRPWAAASVGVRLALTTTLIVIVACAALFFQLTTRERHSLLASKEASASMLASLVAEQLAAPIDFGEADDARNQISPLRSNEDMVATGVWPTDGTAPIARWERGGAQPLEKPPVTNGLWRTDQTVDVTRVVVGSSGKPVGVLFIRLSLDREDRALSEARVRTLWTLLLLAATTAIGIAFVVRGQITAPLGALAEAARRLERGDASVAMALGGRDEIGVLAGAFERMRHAVGERHDRLQQELDLAQRIQSSILPRDLRVPRLRVAAAMVPATQVGGDYYDVLPVPDGCWIGVGDVAGHGLNAGLIMLMMQSIFAALVRHDANLSPGGALEVLNRVLYENIRTRMQTDDHATLTLLRYRDDGTVTFAGAHEDILVLRAATGRCEVVFTPGPWVGGARDIARSIVETVVRLEEGDTVVLYTDGITECRRGTDGEELGIERLQAMVEAHPSATPEELRDAVMAQVKEWSASPDDDVSIVVARYEGAAS